MSKARGHGRRRAVEMLDQVGIDDGERCLQQFPHQLSGGMLQRVMIATALLTKPRLILADEPTTALDVTIQAEVMAIIDALRRELGLALLFITHDLDLAAAVCDRTAVMYAGQIVETQPASSLHEHPFHPYSAALAAARPSISATEPRLAAIPGRPRVGVRGSAGMCLRPALCPRRGSVPRRAAGDPRVRRRRRFAACAPRSCTTSLAAGHG